MNLINELAEVSKYLTEEARDQMLADIVEEAIEELATGTSKEEKWIPVSERLPEPFKDVLVFAKAKEEYDMQIGTGAYIYPNIGWMTRGLPNGACVEYWMPLPEPPMMD